MIISTRPTSYKFDVTNDLIKYIIKDDSNADLPHSDWINSEWADISSLHIPSSAKYPAIELDRESYSQGDTVYITVISPDHADNGVSEIIGDSNDFRINISSKSISMENYKMTEVGDVGIFTNEIVLNGTADDEITITITLPDNETVTKSAPIR